MLYLSDRRSLGQPKAHVSQPMLSSAVTGRHGRPSGQADSTCIYRRPSPLSLCPFSFILSSPFSFSTPLQLDSNHQLHTPSHTTTLPSTTVAGVFVTYSNMATTSHLSGAVLNDAFWGSDDDASMADAGSPNQSPTLGCHLPNPTTGESSLLGNAPASDAGSPTQPPTSGCCPHDFWESLILWPGDDASASGADSPSQSPTSGCHLPNDDPSRIRESSQHWTELDKSVLQPWPTLDPDLSNKSFTALCEESFPEFPSWIVVDGSFYPVGEKGGIPYVDLTEDGLLY